MTEAKYPENAEMVERLDTAAGLTEDQRACTVLTDRACVHCRYNLIGASSESRCPECGAAVRDSLGDVALMSHGAPTVRQLTRAFGRLATAPVLDVALAIVTLAMLTTVGAIFSVRAGASAFGVLAVVREIGQVGVYVVGAAGLIALAKLPASLGGPGAPWIRRMFLLAAVGQVGLSLMSLALVAATGRHPAIDGHADTGWIPRDLAQTCSLAGLCLALHSTERVRWLLRRRAKSRLSASLTAAGSVLTLLGTVIVVRLCFDPEWSFSDDQAATTAHGWLWLGGYFWGVACAVRFARTMRMVRGAESSSQGVGPPHPSRPATVE